MNDWPAIVVAVATVLGGVWGIVKWIIAQHMAQEQAIFKDIRQEIDDLRKSGTDYSRGIMADLLRDYVTVTKLSETKHDLAVQISEVKIDVQHVASAVDSIRMFMAEDKGRRDAERGFGPSREQR